MFGQLSSFTGMNLPSGGIGNGQAKISQQPSLFGQATNPQFLTSTPSASSNFGQPSTANNIWTDGSLKNAAGAPSTLFSAPSGLPGSQASSFFPCCTLPSSTPAVQSSLLLQNATAASGNSVDPAVQAVLSNLSNADARSCHILTDIVHRLKSFIAEPPVFIAFTYEVDSSPQSLAHKKATLEAVLARLNKSHVIEAYNAALKTNPDPSYYAIVPIEGFNGLIERCHRQTQSYEQLATILQDLQNRQEVVRNHMEIQAFRRLKAIRKRHERLQSAVIDIVGMLEEYALNHSVAQLDVSFLKRLKSDIAALSTEVHQSAAGRLHLNETLLKLQEIKATIGLPSTQEQNAEKATNSLPSHSSEDTLQPLAPELTESAYLALKRLLQKQEVLLDNLATSLRADALKAKKLLDFMESDTDVVFSPKPLI